MHSMIFSHFSYCMTVWPQAPSTVTHLTSLCNQTENNGQKACPAASLSQTKTYNLCSFESFLLILVFANQSNPRAEISQRQ